MFPISRAALFNFQARLSCSAGLGADETRRGAGPPYLGVRSPARRSLDLVYLDEARKTKKAVAE